MINKKTAYVLTALVLAPLSLSAQNPDARIVAAKNRAASAGVPVALLESRVAEGRAKGVPMDRIAAAVEQRASALVNAREAMGRSRRDLTAADLNAGADAMQAGIDGESLRSVIEQARGDDRPVAIAVLTYLHGKEGLPVDRALARVTEALKKGPEALRALPGEGKRGRGSSKAKGGAAGGPPKTVPAPGKKPGAGKPDQVGRGNQGGGRGKGGGNKP